jgi:hypothetical protein
MNSRNYIQKGLDCERKSIMLDEMSPCLNI